MARPISRPLICFFSGLRTKRAKKYVGNQRRGAREPSLAFVSLRLPPSSPPPRHGAWSQALKASLITVKTHGLYLLRFSQTRKF